MTIESPYLTTAESAEYLRFKGPSSIRDAVARGELQPCGIGGHRSLLFRREDLDAFSRARLEATGRAAVAPSVSVERRPPVAQSQRSRKAPTRPLDPDDPYGLRAIVAASTGKVRGPRKRSRRRRD